MNLPQVIKEQARHLGFSLVGVTTPDPLPHTDVFEGWLQQGRHGEMAYLNTQRSKECRAHPQNILPECRSVLVLGVNYPAPPRLASGDVSNAYPYGSIAAYAWGDDYHSVLPGRLKKLVDFIDLRVGYPVPNRGYTDTGPLLERELAQRAGLGWIGKNTCLINPERGSYFLLAEILLGIELEPDQPFTTDRCGACRRCIKACPTGCILPDRTLDARRCISYLTIELKGSIPRELRPFMDMHVFGCDICQQVCPWNRFASPEGDPGFPTQQELSRINLLEEIILSEPEFNSKYQRNPRRRSKRKGYLRNIVVALGNSHNQEAAGILSTVLTQEPEPLVRLHAAWALRQIGGEHTMDALKKVLETEPDSKVRQEICNILESG